MEPSSYGRWQRSVSSLLVGAMLFSATFEVPLSLPEAQADAFQRHVDLVSVIVDADVYPLVADAVERYAARIQKELPNTRAVIFPLPRATHPEFIAALNEKLYWDGEPSTKASGTVEQLAGTVLVGDVPLPVVQKNGKSYVSPYPYVDFKDKVFKFDFSSGRFESRDPSAPDARPEIWHGVIAPHTGDVARDAQELRAFFAKAERAYGKAGEFAESGDKPYVFWFDASKEAKAIVPGEWRSYNDLYLANIEDITYRRFTKYLAKYVYDSYQQVTADPSLRPVPFAQWRGSLSGSSNAAMPMDGLPADVVKQMADLGVSSGGAGTDLSTVPDPATRDFIFKGAKRFAEVVNAKYLGDMAKYVYGAGRYNEGATAAVDTPAVLITKKDAAAVTALKDANTLLEKAIDGYVAKNLAQDVPALARVKEKIELYEPVWHDWDSCRGTLDRGTCDSGYDQYRHYLKGYNAYASHEFSYVNFLFGQDVSAITDPAQCTIVRGSSLTGSQYLVEANAAYDPNATKDHAAAILGDFDGAHPDAVSEIPNNTGATTGLCMSYDPAAPETNGFRTTARWGGNSPLNAVAGSVPTALKSQRYTSFYAPILDVGGSKQLAAGSPLAAPASPLDCAKTDLLLAPYSYSLSKWNGETWDTVDEDGTAHGTSVRLPTRQRGWPRDSAFLMDALKTSRAWSIARNPIDNAKLGKEYSCATRFDLTTENDAVFNAYSGYKVGRSGDNQDGKAFDLTPTNDLSKGFAQLLKEGLCVNPAPSGSGVTCAGSGSASVADYGFRNTQLAGLKWVPLDAPIPAWGGDYAVASSRLNGARPAVSSAVDPRLPTDGSAFKRQGITSLTFRRVPSVLAHKSPTDEEYGALVRSMATQSMPVDRDRYVTFVSTQGAAEKVTYPNFFRIKLEKPEDFTPEKADAAIKEHLDAVSAAVNDAADRNDPSKADATALAVRKLMGGSAEKAPKVDLYAQVKGNKELYDIAVESVLWNNLRNAPAKYGYVLDNWLDRDGRTDVSLALNPSHRKDGYEIAYLAGEGSAERLRLDVDPDNAQGAGGDVGLMLARNARFQNFRKASNLAQGAGSLGTSGYASSKVFNCGPAEGVVITKWLPAIQCWLKENMPPRIKWAKRASDGSAISDGSGPESLPDEGPDLSQDADGNGLPDAYEAAVKGAALSVEFAKGTYDPGTSFQFAAGLKGKDGKWLAWDQRTVVNFSVSKITATESGALVTHVPGADAAAWAAVVGRYLNFTPRAVRAVDGVATYGMSGKGLPATVWVTAEIRPTDKNGDVVTGLAKRSEPAEVSLEKPPLSVTAAAGETGQPQLTGEDYVAGEERGVRFTVTSADAGKRPALPITVTVSRRDSDEILQTLKIAALPADGTWEYRWTGANEAVLSKADDYVFRFEDRRGFADSARVSVVPAAPAKLELATASDALVKGVAYDGVLKLQDRFGNLVAGHPKPAALRAAGPAKLAVGDQPAAAALDPYLFEGFAAFRVTAGSAGDVTLNASVPTDAGTLSASVALRAVDAAKASLSFGSGAAPAVGGAAYPFTLRMTDGDGNPLPVNTVATFHFPESLGRVEPAAVAVENGVAKASLVTGFVAARSAKIDVDVPGVSDVSGNLVTVLPGDPMTVEVRPARADLDADGQDVTTVQAVLLDRYGNTVFRHSPEYAASFDVRNGYALAFGSGQALSNVKFTEGETPRLIVRSTQFAGTAYVTATVAPALEKNAFTYVDPQDAGKALEVNGISSNAAPVLTAYSLDAQRVGKMRYNALVTVLLGGAYGDVTRRGYLGGALLFSEGSKAMAVATLTSAPTPSTPVLEFAPAGRLTMRASDEVADLSAEWGVRDGTPAVDFFNRLDKTMVARAWLPMDAADAATAACDPKDGDVFGACSLPKDGAAMALVGSPDAGTRAVKVSGGLQLVAGGNVVAAVGRDGAISGRGVSAVPDADAAASGLVLAISSGGQRVGSLLLRFPSDGGVDLVREGEPRAANRVSVEIASTRFSAARRNVGNSTNAAEGLAVELAAEGPASTDPALAQGASVTGFESHLDEDAVGWTGENKTLLEVAAGVPVGESVRKYQGWTTIVLGDPVFSLAAKAKARADGSKPDFDHAVGESVGLPAGNLVGYDLADVNGDGTKDVLGYLDDGSVQLWGNFEGRHKPLSLLLSAPDVGANPHAAGDFFGDRYDDVVAVNGKGKLVTFSNVRGQFSRIPTAVVGEPMAGRITQMVAYDVDDDGRADLVTVDDAGTLSVLYGTPGEKFTRVVVDRSLGVRLDPRSLVGAPADAAVYYEGAGGVPVPQAAQAAAADYASCESAPSKNQSPAAGAGGGGGGGFSINFIDPSILNLGKLQGAGNKAANAATANGKTPCQIDAETKAQTAQQQVDVINQFLFYKEVMPARRDVPADATAVPANAAQTLNELSGTDEFGNPNADGASLAQGFAEVSARAASGAVDYAGLYQAGAGGAALTLLRNPFTDTGAISVTKSYTGTLEEGKPLTATLTVRNVSRDTLSQIVVADRDNKAFAPNEDGEYALSYRGNETVLPMREDPASEFTYLYDLRAYPLKPGEALTITYGLTAPRMQVGKIQVGRYEESGDGSDGPDAYGDVLYSPSKSCSATKIFWSSTNGGAGRAFRKGVKTYRDGSLDGNQDPAVKKAQCDMAKAADLANSYGDPDAATKAANANSKNGVAAADAVMWTTDLIPPPVYAPIPYKPFFGIFLPDALKTGATFRKPNSGGGLGGGGGAAGSSLGEGCSAADSPEQYSRDALSEFNKDQDADGIPDRAQDDGSDLLQTAGSAGLDEDGNISLNLNLGINEQQVDELDSKVDAFVSGLGCGFGGGGCISSPINYAPLAPGASPVAFGIPLNVAALTPYTWGLPIFAASTNCILPMTWPPCPIGAGGWIVPLPPISSFRLYVTPTITGAVGTTMCFGPNVSAYATPPGVSPLVPGGNCINIAMPIPGLCKGDGSDGDAGNLGPASRWNASGDAQKGGNGGSDNAFVNAESCDQDPAVTEAQNAADAAAMAADARAYLASKGTNFTAGNSFLGRAKRNAKAAKMPPEMPLIQIGGGGMFGGDGEDDLGFDLDLDLSAGAGGIVKVKNVRIPSFPDYIMNWVTDQIEEIVNKLLTLPRLIITLPDFSGLGSAGAGDQSWGAFFKKFGDGSVFKALEQKKQAATQRKAKVTTDVGKAVSGGARGAASWASGALPLDSMSNTVGGIRALFDFVGNLPLIDLDWRTIRVPIPWFGTEDLDAWIVRNEAIYRADVAEIDRFVDDAKKLIALDPEKYASLVRITADLDALSRSVETNLKTVQSYKDFPKKLSKYVRWKEKYVSDIVNNYLEPVSQLLGGWMSDNGKRFKAWVELIVLIKAILKSWQVLIDIFADFNAQCQVCRVQRYDLKYWLIKLISMLIPKIPIIIFPKWPDVELDLHDISLGVKLAMPEFDFDLVPIKLPTLVPRVYLPEIPPMGLDVNLKLPAIPQLPQLPELPPLPELPLLPLPILPDLPPPPVLPKLMASINAVISILKLLLKLLCILNKNPFAPEWDSGVIIAMLTDRSGPLPIDKLFVNFGFPPNPSMTYLDRIKVSTHVNLKFDVDFIVEMIQQALDPYSRAAEGLANSVRDVKVPDVDLRNLVPENVRNGVRIDVSVGADGKVDADSSLDEKKLQGAVLDAALLAAIGMRQIAQALEAARDERGGTREGFKAALAREAAELPVTEHPGYARIAQELRGAAAYSGQDEDARVAALRSNMEAKFSLLGRTLQEEARKAAAQAAQIDAAYAPGSSGQGLEALAGAGAFRLASEKADAKPDFAPFNERLGRAALALVDPQADPRETEASSQKARLLARVDAGLSDFAKTVGLGYRGMSSGLASAAVTAAAATTEASASADGRRYSYQGVYVLNAGRSERLFDYVDEVDADTKVVPSPDGGVYTMMGNRIWYKANLNKLPSRYHVTSAPATLSEREARANVLLISANAPVSDAKLPPDGFKSTTQDAGRFGFEFEAANPGNDSHWRVQAHRNVTYPAVPADPDGARERWILELFTGLDEKSYDPERTETGTVGYTHVATFHEASAGEGSLTQKKVWRTLLPDGMYRDGLDGAATPLPGRLTVRAAQPLYTGYYDARIRSVDANGKAYEKYLAPRSRYVFDMDRQVEVLTGEIYLLGEEDETRQVSFDKWVGMPILPGAEITVGPRSHLTVSFNDGTHLRIPENTHFFLVDLGARGETYRGQVGVPDGLYYGTIRTVDRTQDIEGYSSMLGWQTLFAPSKESDVDAPTLNMGRTIRVPVNAERTVNFEKYALDAADVAQFKVEGLPAEVSRPAGGESKPLLWKFGPFPHSGKKKVKVSAADAQGNWAQWDVDLVVSVPDAKIVDATVLGDEAQVTGRVSVQEKGVPVEVFRFRDGDVTKATGTWLATDAQGGFSFTGTSRGQAVLRGAAGEVARFDSVTGAPAWLAAGWTAKFVPSTDKEAAHLAVADAQGNVAYRQFWALKRPASLAQAASAAQVPAQGNGWWWVPTAPGDPAALRLERASAADPSIPGGAYLARASDARGVVALSSGGQAYLLNSGFAYSLEYATDDAGWPSVKVKKDGLEIGVLHLRTTAPYVNE